MCRFAVLPDVDASQVGFHLDTLAEKGLVTRTGDETRLTPMGRAAVNEHIEDVNR